MGWFSDEEEFEETEEISYTAEEFEGLKKSARVKRRAFAIIHLVLSVCAFVGCCIWAKTFIYAVLAYIVGHLVIQGVFSLLSNIGDEEEGGYVDVYIGNGRYEKRWNEFAVTKYGFFDIIKELIAHGLFFLLVFFLTNYFLPKFVFFYVLIGEMGIAVIKYLVLPIIKDITHIVSKSNREKLFNNIDKFVAIAGLVIVVIASIVSYIIFPNFVPQKLNIECFERYAQRKDETNNLENLSIEDLNIEFKNGSTVAQITYEGEFKLSNGIVKHGKVNAKCEYDLQRWNVSNIYYVYDDEVKIVSPVTYVGEKSGFATKNYENPVIIKLRIDYFDGTSGKGNYEVLDKKTGDVVLTSPLSIQPAFSSGMEFHFEGEDKVGIFGVLEGEYNQDSDTIIIDYVGQQLKLEK